MRGIRKIKYIRRIITKLKRRRASGQRVVSKFTLSVGNNPSLYALLAKKKPLKIVSKNLPTFQLPKTVKVVICDSKESLKPQGLIPYEEQEEGVILTEVPADEFLTYKGPLDLSIAQMKLAQDQVSIPPFVREYFSLRQCGVESSTIEAINLWFYKGRRLSSWHYDGHDNFLFMLQGEKVVYLLPPTHKGIQAKSIFNTNNNHFQEDMASLELGKQSTKCVLNKGQCLFIPRGWWHEVHSYGRPNVAINIWGNSLSKIISKEEEQAMLRHLVLTISDQLSANIFQWDDWPEKMREQYRKARFQIYLNCASREKG